MVIIVYSTPLPTNIDVKDVITGQGLFEGTKEQHIDIPALKKSDYVIISTQEQINDAKITLKTHDDYFTVVSSVNDDRRSFSFVILKV